MLSGRGTATAVADHFVRVGAEAAAFVAIEVAAGRSNLMVAELLIPVPVTDLLVVEWGAQFSAHFSRAPVQYFVVHT
jgi:Na+/glutamate symporter